MYNSTEFQKLKRREQFQFILNISSSLIPNSDDTIAKGENEYVENPEKKNSKLNLEVLDLHTGYLEFFRQ